MVHRSNETPLHAAAQYGRLPVVQWLVQQGGATVNQADIEGATCLHDAAREGQLPVVEWLVMKGGASVNQINTESNETPLSVAVQCGQLPVVQWLVKQGGAAVNQADRHGNTPLYHAVWQKCYPVVEWAGQGSSGSSRPV